LDAGIGYAGASRPDETATTAPRGYFNMPKWLQLKDEWQQLFKTQLQALDLEHQHDSPDPYEALKQAEMLGLSKRWPQNISVSLPMYAAPLALQETEHYFVN
jgi:hypothetical protein